MADIQVHENGTLIWNEKTYRCAIGKNGCTEDKKEGDGKTPIGCFPVGELFYRADKIEKPNTVLPLHATRTIDGWCDDPDNSRYNTFVKLPYEASAEKLWREDDIYDIVLTLGYNDNPIVPGKGSAIFLHIARENYSGTEGCIALSLPDMLEILSTIQNNTLVCIQK